MLQFTYAFLSASISLHPVASAPEAIVGDKAPNQVQCNENVPQKSRQDSPQKAPAQADKRDAFPEDWNPMVQHFSSEVNSYGVDMDDAWRGYNWHE